MKTTELSNQKESEKRLIERELEEEKQKVGNLEATKERLLKKNDELNDENKKFQAEIAKLEGVLEGYANPGARATIKTVVSENVARVAQEKEREKVKEELVAAR